MARARVLLADDHVLLLEAFARLLEADYEIVGTAADGRELVRMASELAPEAIVADMSMPELDGIEATRRILAERPQTRVVLLTVHEDPTLAADALRAGAAAYVVKRSAAGELRQALREALAGRTFLTRLVAGGDVAALAGLPPSPRERLSPREREVLQLLADGLSMKEVAARLDITPRTVAFHKYQMIEKLELRTSADLVRFAVANRLVSDPPAPGKDA